ncbi:zinc-binding dehydrogenase [Hirsutella rhossiliensis]|uniref:Dehydrogenase FUB6 n=1 Tax=Hirsutella rhossiliensis TaxID=111463 RepID=A0A9P8SHP9_9HYPO|nr:zinc-binding dehydrogenase domain-containing protein [Hirsutella rhossiliensis]KAH0961790.1 zinc-binding dehydrogenase domain-containing protein [Hirsutella rhossiliensis]
MAPNKSLIFKKIPTGVPVPGEHLAVETRDIDLETPPPGGLIVEVLYASFDPYLRGRMRDPSVKSYVPAFEAGQPFANATVSRVLKSGSPDFGEGDLVVASTAIAEYARIEKAVAPAVNKIRNPHGLDLGLFLGPLGMPGLTAWSGLHKIGKPQKGQTVFVSSAAGAVGQVVGQVAKREGLTVIGSVGDDDKLDFITKDLGFDAGFNYKKEKPLDALRRLAPKGIDIYFENVGGDQLEAALEAMNDGGRIAACGMISDYNTPQSQRKGIQNLMHIVAKQITMQGFLVTNPDFGPAYAKEHQEKLQEWLGDGSIKAKLHVTDGIDKSAEAFVGMLRGENFGKAVLRIKGESAGSKI